MGEASRVSPFVDYPRHGVGEASSRSGRRVIKDHAGRRVVSDRRRPTPRQARRPAARQPAVRAPPAVLRVNPRGATPRPAAADDVDDLVGVYKGGCLLYLTHRRTFNQAEHRPGVSLSRRVGTTPVGDDSGEIFRPARSRSLPGGRAEGPSRHGVQRRGLHQRSPSSAGELLTSDDLLEGATGALDSDAGMEILDPNNSENEINISQEGNEDILESVGKLSVSEGMELFIPKINKLKFPQDGEDIVESFGKLKLSEGTVEDQFLKIEKMFIDLIESADLVLEMKLLDLIHTLAQDNQAWVEYMALSDPSSDSDNYEDDPDYEDAGDDHESVGAGAIGESDDDDDDDGEDEDEDEDEDEEEEEEEEDDDEEDDDEEDDDEEDDEEEDEEDDEEEEDLNYDPKHSDDEDDDEEYMNGIVNLPPLPAGTKYWRGVTIVNRVGAIRDLNPEFHVLGFGPKLSIHKRIRMWVTGDMMGFDFLPSEMLRYVWRMELLLNGQNPGNRDDRDNEPPVPNPGNYDSGWATDEEMAGSGAENWDQEDRDEEDDSGTDMDED